MDSENKRVIGYDPQTGQPIYEYTQLNQVQSSVVQNSTLTTTVPQQSLSSNGKRDNKAKFLILGGIVVILMLTLVILFLLFEKNNSLSRTVMIYMVGSDLEANNGLATADLDSIKYNEKVKVILIAGGTPNWHNNYIEKNETSIYELTPQGFKKVKQQTVRNMGDSLVLSDFLNYTYDNYKSNKYELLFWNHGGAILGSEFDLISDDNLSLTEMEEGLKNSPFNDRNKLEVIIFRTCMNGTVELANIFKNYAQYLVASEEITYGAPYTNVLSFINNVDSNDNAVELSKKYVSSYKNQISDIKGKTIWQNEDSIYSTYSIIDLSKINNLSKSVNEFFDDINIASNFNKISRIRANLYQYGSSEPSYDMVDLYNLVYSLKDLSPDKANRVLSNLDNTIIYNWATNNESRGMSIYFPYNGTDKVKLYFLDIYSSFDDLTSYNNFIKGFYKVQKSDYTKYSYTSNLINVKASDEEEVLSDFTLELTDEQVETFAKARYFVFRDNKNGYFKPIYTGGKAVLDGKTLKAGIRDRQLKVRSKDDPNEGYTLISIEKENTDKYIKYETNVILQSFRGDIKDWKNDKAIITLMYDKTTKKVAMSNIVYNTGDDLVNSSVVDLDNYDNVEFSVSSGWQITDEEGFYTGPYDSDGKIRSDGIYTGWEDKPGNFEFVLESFDSDDDYYGVFAITDTHNNISYSKLVKMN